MDYRRIVHSPGICEKDFKKLADEIKEHVNNLRFDLAFQQLERCASARERVMNYYRTVQRPNGNKTNEKHQYAIDRVRGLMKKINIGLIIGITPSEWSSVKITYETNYFIIKYKPDNQKKYVEITRKTTHRVITNTPSQSSNPSQSFNLSQSSNTHNFPKMTKTTKFHVKKTKGTLKTKPLTALP